MFSSLRGLLHLSVKIRTEGGKVTHSLPASMTRMDRLGFSARRPATQFPAVPPLYHQSDVLRNIDLLTDHQQQ